MKAVVVLSTAAALLSACDRGPATLPLADGCYYAGSVPVLRITGSGGVVLVRSDVQEFTITRAEGRVTVSPAFLFDGGNPLIASRRTDVPDQTFPLVAGTPVPTVHWAMWGDGEIDLARGRAC